MDFEVGGKAVLSQVVVVDVGASRDPKFKESTLHRAAGQVQCTTEVLAGSLAPPTAILELSERG